ncbi:MAG: DNA recombination protein RmuC [Flavobacteriaceae bacterium]|nr:DNA recombination protein RmuC [Flavobacteriaceae bacterium]
MTISVTYFILIIIGAVLVAFALAYLWWQQRLQKQQNSFFEREREISETVLKLEQEKQWKIEEVQKITTELNRERELGASSQNRIEELLQKLTRTEAEKQALGETLQTQKQDLTNLQERFQTQFENLAGKILKQNTEDFSQTQQKKMVDLLSPLKEKIATFEKKVEETYEKGLKDQTDLRAELKKLHELNSKISLEANNLTKALKGDVKQQGNWGELVLERILDRSGLTKGVEYEREVVAENEAGTRIRPDVIIKLPENKHIIVDSKVSLLAYEKAVNAETDEERLLYQKEHLNSIKKHIKGLADKHYQSASLFDSPDFVLLFIPVESSFSLAVQQDSELFNIAWDNKIVIVSPSTLLATLRTVSSIWRQEQQTQNVQEIARQGGALYDKFVNFYADLEKVGKKMQEAQTAYKDSMKKLYDGNDNLVRKAERLRDLGARTKKELPLNIRERAGEC